MQAVKTLDPQGRSDAEHRADHRRVGDRQGAGRPGLACAGTGAGRGVPGGQLRGDPPRPAGEPALRPCPRRLHRRRPRPRRPVRGRRPGYGLPRRDRRAVAVDPGQAAPRDREQGGPAGGRHPAGLVPGPADHGHQQGPHRRGRRPSVPGRPVLPAQRGDRSTCPRCATAATISPTWSPRSWPSTPGAWASGSTASTTRRSAA